MLERWPLIVIYHHVNQSPQVDDAISKTCRAHPRVRRQPALPWNPCFTITRTRNEATLRPGPHFFWVHVQKWGGFSKVECLHMSCTFKFLSAGLLRLAGPFTRPRIRPAAASQALEPGTPRIPL